MQTEHGNHVKLVQASFTAQEFSISQLYFLMDEL